MSLGTLDAETRGTAAHAEGETILAKASASVVAPPKTYSDAYKWYIVILLMLVYVSNFADRMIMAILLPDIQAEFNAPNWAMGLLAGTMFAIFYATLGLPIAMLADRSNRVRIISISALIWSAMTALCGTAAGFWQFALYRIGVGVGEAGGTPPSQSIISDLFTQKSRGTALGVFALGVPFGLVVGLYGGAQIAHAYDWRWAFIALGVPGVILALLVYLTIDEPQRGAAEGKALAGSAQVPFLETLWFMISQRSVLHVMIGGTLTTFVGYSGVTWWPKWIMTAHGLPATSLSLFMALVFGLAGALATIASGYLGDHFGRRNPAYMPRLVSIALALSVPFGLLLYSVESVTLVFAIIALPAFLGSFYQPPSYAVTQGAVSPRMRAVAIGVLLFVFNLIGMGLGPLITGAIADWLEPTYGKGGAIGYALMAVTLINLWAAVHYWIAGQSYEADLKRAQNA